MIEVYSVSQIKEGEAQAMRFVEEDELIERASNELYAVIESRLTGRAVIFAGGGNNGSDALSLAVRLADKGVEVVISICSEKLNGCVQRRIETLKALGVTFSNDVDIFETDVVVDGIFGIGLNRDVTDSLATLFRRINASGAFVLSVDIPSGLNADTGRVQGEAIRADVTVTFSGVKRGLVLGYGRNYVGEIIVADIGICLPSACEYIIEGSDFVSRPRLTVSNKGNYGNVKIIAGSPTMIGASLLAHESALSALRGGTGYAVLAVPKSLADVYQMRVKEELLFFMPDTDGKMIFDTTALDELMKRATSIVIGMGLGKNVEVIKIISYLSQNFCGTLVIDGDGLNALSEDISAVNGHKCRLILTPHVKEFERLYGISELPDDEKVFDFAQRLRAVVAMKSATTIISDGEKIFLNVSGTPAMAKAGSGDVLSGIIGAYCNGDDLCLSVARACYDFGKAGERAMRKRGENAVIASDLIDEI